MTWNDLHQHFPDHLHYRDGTHRPASPAPDAAHWQQDADTHQAWHSRQDWLAAPATVLDPAAWDRARAGLKEAFDERAQALAAVDLDGTEESNLQATGWTGYAAGYVAALAALRGLLPDTDGAAAWLRGDATAAAELAAAEAALRDMETAAAAARLPTGDQDAPAGEPLAAG